MNENISLEEKNEKINIFSSLRKMATTKRLKHILNNHIENETIPSVRTAWIEYFLEIKHKKIRL
jgi:hypothetical protein